MALRMVNGVRVAVEGCGHGTLNAIYASIQKSCQVKGWDGIDLLIIGGDFQAVRNTADLSCMAVPAKYREIGDFHRYYSGVRKAPYLTIFVGGNHEASNHLFELYYGGWVAPNIYYMGASNVLRLGPLRIAALSGIWKGYNYKKPHYERLPYNQDDVRSIYHVRELDTRKLLQVRTPVDIGISHDWPRGVEWLGDHKWLFKKKDLFEKDAIEGNLGSVAAKLALDHLKPAYWFSAHLHIKYAATVSHSDEQKPDARLYPTPKTMDLKGTNNHVTIQNNEKIDLDMDEDEPESSTAAQSQVHTRNEDEIDLDLEDSLTPGSEAHPPSQILRSDPQTGPTVAPVNGDTFDIPASLLDQLPASFTRRNSPPLPDPPTSINNDTTKFLALDKCLPHRDFLQLLEINPLPSQTEILPQPSLERPYKLQYDPEFLAITRALASELHLAPSPASLPTTQVTPAKSRVQYLPMIEAEEKWVDEHITKQNKLDVPENFTLTAPVYDGLPIHAPGQAPPVEYTNPQTTAFCTLLGIENRFDMGETEREVRIHNGPREAEERGRGGRRSGRGRGGYGPGRGGGGRGFGGGRDRGRGGGAGRGAGGRGGWRG